MEALTRKTGWALDRPQRKWAEREHDEKETEKERTEVLVKTNSEQESSIIETTSDISRRERSTVPSAAGGPLVTSARVTSVATWGQGQVSEGREPGGGCADWGALISYLPEV